MTIALIVGAVFPAPLQTNLGDKELANIGKLHDRGWEERQESNFEASERMFREAERKLKDYRSRYIKDQSTLSFLRATYRLAYLSELGNKDKDAREFYEQCLAHPLINSPAAKADEMPISQLARERLTIVEGRLRHQSKSSGEDYPRVSIKGGSKGEKNLPGRSSDLRP